MFLHSNLDSMEINGSLCKGNNSTSSRGWIKRDTPPSQLRDGPMCLRCAQVPWAVPAFIFLSCAGDEWVCSQGCRAPDPMLQILNVQRMLLTKETCGLSFHLLFEASWDWFYFGSCHIPFRLWTCIFLWTREWRLAHNWVWKSTQQWVVTYRQPW